MERVLFYVLSLTLIAAAVALAREVRLRRALQKLLNLFLGRRMDE